MVLAEEQRGHLVDQAGFLRSSLEGFFRGAQAEALRIATTIRLLVHDTRESVALLKQIDADWQQLGILDRASGMPGILEAASQGRVGLLLPLPIGLGALRQTGFDTVESTYYPRIPLSAWWSGVPAMIIGDEELRAPRTFTREGLVKLLANKVGGAHVHPGGPPEYYGRLILERPILVNANGVTDSRNAAYWIVAQSGAELLEALSRRYGV